MYDTPWLILQYPQKISPSKSHKGHTLMDVIIILGELQNVGSHGDVLGNGLEAQISSMRFSALAEKVVKRVTTDYDENCRKTLEVS